MYNPKAPRSENFSDCECFPFEIITEILSRVPVKALGRFTTVCKSWHSLITSEMFINTHLKNYCISIANGHSTSNQSPNIFLMPSYIKELEKYSYALFCDNTFVERATFAIPVLYSWLELLFVGNSCNGIICFTDQKAFYGRKVFLYNPSLKKIKVISHDCFADSMYDRRRVYSKLGFGFSGHNNDLKVVRVHYVKDRNSKMLGNVPPQVEVYSLKADCWRRITADIKCMVHHRSVSCNGAIYWLARRRDRWGCDTILSFNVANEVFCEIALPAESNSFIDGTILVFKGLLAFCKDAWSNRDGFKCYELWVLMEYNVTNSWTKLSILETDQPVSKVIGFTKSGKLIMQMDCGTLASWDPLNNQLEILMINGFLNHVDAAFVESLVLYGEQSIASAEATVLLIGTSSSMGIMKPLDLPLHMGTHKIAIHGDDVMVRVAGDVATVDFGVNELKNLCRRQPALVGIMARPQSTPLALQLSVQNYCLIVQQHHFDCVPQSLKDFLANPAICFMNIGADKLRLSPFNLEKNGIQFRDLVRRALNKQNLHGLRLKPLAAEVGVTLDEFSVGSFLDWKTEVFSEAELKLAIHHIYACYKIGKMKRKKRSMATRVLLKSPPSEICNSVNIREVNQDEQVAVGDSLHLSARDVYGNIKISITLGG